MEEEDMEYLILQEAIISVCWYNKGKYTLREKSDHLALNTLLLRNNFSDCVL